MPCLSLTADPWPILYRAAKDMSRSQFDWKPRQFDYVHEHTSRVPPFFPSLTYTEPPYLEALLSSPDGKDLVAAWTDLVSSCHQATDAAAAAAAAAADRARGGKAKAGGKAGASKGGSCAGGGGGGADAAAAAATAVKHLLQRVHTDLGGRSKVCGSCNTSRPRCLNHDCSLV